MRKILIMIILTIVNVAFAEQMTIHLNNGQPPISVDISSIEMITFEEGFFVWCEVPAGEYTYGPGDTIKTLNYDYQIMKYEVTNIQYVNYLTAALAEGNIWIEEGNVVGYYEGDEQWSAGNYIFYELGELSYGNYARISYDSNAFIINVPFGYFPGDFNNHPVVFVSWFGAWGFVEHYEYSLPTEFEWEKSARGNTGWDYPWGNIIDGSRANYWSSGDPWEGGTTPVGFYNGQECMGFQTTNSPSPYGVYDMAGNILELTNSFSSPSSPFRITRGGSWNYCVDYQRSWLRSYEAPTFRAHFLGFRCVRIQ